MKNGEETPKRPVGRPQVWETPGVLQKLVDNYFDSETKPTLAGLSCALDVSRSTLYNYEHKDEFLHIIKKARQRVERIYEETLMYGDRPTGVIFALKNMGWSDKTDIDHTTKGKELPAPLLGGASVHRNNGDPEAK